MKKGLSILLIAAALFGFYGAAVNLNDVLACKDYWEEEGERTTADMNKLEDGLNQLKENEKLSLQTAVQLSLRVKLIMQQHRLSLQQAKKLWLKVKKNLLPVRKNLLPVKKNLKPEKSLFLILIP